ncbi:MAG: hypothetical protein CUN55_18675, partial [Phototrophicales bacterium]
MQSSYESFKNRASILLPHFRQHSYFITTERNTLLYWLATLVIYPVYATCVILLSFTFLPSITFFSNLSDPMQFALQTALILIFVAPITTTLFIQRYWQMGFAGRELTVFASIFIYITLIHSNKHLAEEVNDIIALSSGIW